MEKYLQEITSLSEEQINQFKIYYETLLEESEKYNLTNLKTEEEIYIKHFLDSIIMIKYIDLEGNKSLADVGTGAGFPGIPLKIIKPDLKITLIEPTLKRCNFLNLIIKKLNLKDIEVINDRAENVVKEKRESFDILTARAVAGLNILLELLTPLTKQTGKIIILKGDVTEELNKATTAIKKLKLKQNAIYTFNLPLDLGKRTIIEFNKKEKTPLIYPRAFAKIKKQPL